MGCFQLPSYRERNSFLRRTTAIELTFAVTLFVIMTIAFIR